MGQTRLRPLVVRSLARLRPVFLAVAAVLTGFQVMLVVIASTLQTGRSFALMSAMMPMGVQQAFGPSVFMLASFAGLTTFGYFHPVVVLAVTLVGAFAATEPAGEVEWGLFDLELARPVPRRDVVTRSLIVSFGVTAFVGCAMMAGTFAGLAALAPAGSAWPRFPRVLALVAHLAALSWVFAAAGLVASALAKRRGAAFGGVAVIVVSLYLLNFIADAWDRLAALRPYLPFHYFPGFEVASGTAHTARDVGVLLATAAVLTAAAYWRFERRDL
jgi:ABC-type transport system involved in multi-copper enzyme maturation permease subunit